LWALLKQIQEEKEMSTIRISHKSKSKLAKIGARLTLKDGKTHSMEEIIEILMQEYEKDHKE
jgi:ABC-type thiamine transport system ATPase subunit